MEDFRQSAVDMLNREFEELCFFPDHGVRADAQETYRTFRQISGNGITPEQIAYYATRLQEFTRRVYAYRQAHRGN
jgi:hypothetical protein